MSELETDNDERPLEPPRIKTTEILNNPFDDITVRDIKHKSVSFTPDLLESKLNANNHLLRFRYYFLAV